MSYLTASDFKLIVRDHILDAIIDADPTILQQCIDSAVSQIKQYLNGRYDTTLIFAQTGANRHPYLMRCVAYIARYIYMDRVPSRDTGGATKWEKDYNDTLSYLSDIRDGKLEADLPRKLDANNQPKTLFAFDSESKRSIL